MEINDPSRDIGWAPNRNSKKETIMPLTKRKKGNDSTKDSTRESKLAIFKKGKVRKIAKHLAYSTKCYWGGGPG